MRQKIPFVGPSYTSRSLNADSQRAVNCYIEVDATNQRAPSVLYGTPGTVLKLTLPTSPVRNGIKQGQYTWWISGGTVYRVSSIYTYLAIGTIGTNTGELGIASNGNQILIVDGVGGWIIDVAASTLTKIADPQFPNGVTRATYQDGYFIVTGDASQKFYINENPYDGANWNGLDFASAEGSPDNTIGVISDHRELWLFGNTSAEVWVNTGNADFPFQRSGNTFIEHGCAAAGTIAKADNTVFWLGTDDRGAGIVWRADGYTPVRISTNAIEYALGTYTTLSDAYAFAYQQEGHVFYVLIFPTANKTWVYDCASQTWHERVWLNPLTGSENRWRSSCHVFANEKHLVGDFQTGKIYALELSTYTDNGDAILRLRRTISEESGQLMMFYGSLQVDMETGVGTSTGQGQNPVLMLRYSNNGGHTWSNQKTATVGNIGQYGARCKFNRLGSGRNRVWEISMTDPVKFAVMGAVAEIEVGTS